MRSRGIKLMFAVAILQAGSSAAMAQPPAPAPDCQLQLITRLDMRTTPDGRITIPVTVDGHDYQFLVDTGGYTNTVSKSLVKAEGYSSSHADGAMRGMGNAYLDRYVTVREFTIGHSHGTNFKFFVDDFDSIYWDGTLAPEVLGAYDVDLDFAHEKLSLISPDHCPGKVVYWANDAAVVPMQLPDRAHITVPVQIDGKDITATLDTGSHTSFISMRAARRYLGIDEKDDRLKSLGEQTINGMTATTYSFPFQTMNFGNVTVNRPHIVIVPDQMYKQTDLILGEGILRQLHMYIAYKEKKLYLTPALAGRAPN